MKAPLLFLLCTLIPFILTDTEFVATTIIDDFEVSSETLRVIVPLNGDLPRQATLETVGDNILGGERDLILVAESGTPESMISTGVSGGVWTSTSPNGCSGFSSLQYDGPEGSTSVSKTGLNCTDITLGGGNQFMIEAASNNPTDIKLFIYDNQERESSLRLSVLPSDATVKYYLNFTTFPGSVDFSCIGAIELTATILNNAQFYVSNFAVGHQVQISPTPSPSGGVSPTRTPTKSSTNTRTALPSLTIIGPTVSGSPSSSPLPPSSTPSASRTRAPSPSPSPSPTPSSVYPCSGTQECAHLNNGCSVGICRSGICAAEICPFECNRCDEFFNECTNCPEPESSDDQGGVSIGLIVGPVVAGVVVCGICVVIVVAFVIYKKKQSSSSVSVYDTMIGDM